MTRQEYEEILSEYMPIACPSRYIQIEKMPVWNASLYEWTPTPEELTMKKELFEKLSDDSKYLLDMIYNAQHALWEMMQTPKGKFTKKTITKFLKEGGWKTPKINKVFRELTNFVRS